MSEAAAAVIDVAGVLDLREREGIDASPPPDRFLRALAVAAFLHAFVAWVALGGPEALLGGLLPALFPPPQQQSQPIGDKAGRVDGVAAEVIDAAEFDKKYVSFKTGKDEAEIEPAPTEHAARPPPQPQQQNSEPEEKLETSALTSPPPMPQPKRETRPAEQPVFSAAEIDQLLSNSMQDIQGVAVAIEKAGAAKQGDASPYVRAVVRKLKETMPKTPGMRGTVTVQFIIGDDGGVAGARIARSSGNPALDNLVLQKVLATKFAPPTSSTRSEERKFQISYDYL